MFGLLLGNDQLDVDGLDHEELDGFDQLELDGFDQLDDDGLDQLDPPDEKDLELEYEELLPEYPGPAMAMAATTAPLRISIKCICV